MRHRTTRTGRIYAAIALTIIYAICLVTPTLALAFGSVSALPCITGDHHGLAVMHSESHDHGTTSSHHASGQTHNNSRSQEQDHSLPMQTGGKQKDMACCSLLCVTAVTPELSVAIGRPLQSSTILHLFEPGLSGRDAARIERPPSTTFMTV
jgi:hypothetical protein